VLLRLLVAISNLLRHLRFSDPALSVVARKIWGMGASTREEIVEVFAALDAEVDRLCELSFDAFTTPERLRALERLERVTRRLRAP
jgi:hypothetical protein